MALLRHGADHAYQKCTRNEPSLAQAHQLQQSFAVPDRNAGIPRRKIQGFPTVSAWRREMQLHSALLPLGRSNPTSSTRQAALGSTLNSKRSLGDSRSSENSMGLERLAFLNGNIPETQAMAPNTQQSYRCSNSILIREVSYRGYVQLTNTKNSKTNVYTFVLHRARLKSIMHPWRPTW